MPTYFPDDLRRRAELATLPREQLRTMTILGAWQGGMIPPADACRLLRLPVRDGQTYENLDNLLREFRGEIVHSIQCGQSLAKSLEIVKRWVSDESQERLYAA